jgi:hypothetical protein
LNKNLLAKIQALHVVFAMLLRPANPGKRFDQANFTSCHLISCKKAFVMQKAITEMTKIAGQQGLQYHSYSVVVWCEHIDLLALEQNNDGAQHPAMMQKVSLLAGCVVVAIKIVVRWSHCLLRGTR